MSSKLPESTRLAYARQLADEAKTLVPGMERLSAIARELRADDLYRLLGFDTWERFCVDYLGVSKWTANRWISGDKPKSISAGQGVAAVQDAPIVESEALKIPAASTEAPAKQSEGVAPASETVPEPLLRAPSGKSSEGSGPGMPQTRPGVAAPSGPSSGGAELQPTPAGPTGETTAPRPAPPDLLTVDPLTVEIVTVAPRPPSDRQLAARVFAAMREIEPTDAGPVTTPEEATFLRQWAQRTLDAWKAVYAPPALAEKPQRRQGTITRPQAAVIAGRAIMPARFNSTSAPQIAPAPVRTGKRHADDCSCLSCKAPKAVAK